MSLFVVDVEADGPAPGLYSMVSFGVVEVTAQGPGAHFYGQVAPIVADFIPEALAVSGHSRADHEKFEQAEVVLPLLVQWLADNNKAGRPVFVSDNPAFDWQFINYYLWRYTKGNPFGHSARRIGDFYAGLQRDFFARQDWRKLKITKHTHHPVDDARGNVEALTALIALTKKNA